MKRSVLVAALMPCSGCSVMIQNRYSVLGIDVGEVGSASEASFWSLTLLVGVAVLSAVLAVLAFWLGQRWLARRRMRSKEILLAGSPPPTARVTQQAKAGEETPPSPEGSFAVRS